MEKGKSVYFTVIIKSHALLIQTIIQASKERADNMHLQLEKDFLLNKNMTVKCHKTCVSVYTSKRNIELVKKK